MQIETEWVVYRTSEIHGTGGFARVAIPAETTVTEYVGQKITKAESLKRCELNNEYIFDWDDDYDLDGNVDWNPARFINHSCSPNCEAQWDGDHIWIVALRNITAGEELTFNYGYDLVDYREHPCRCGAANCVGFIAAAQFHDQIRRLVLSQTAPQETAPVP